MIQHNAVDRILVAQGRIWRDQNYVSLSATLVDNIAADDTHSPEDLF
jgi:hypothetical protein